MKSFLSSFGKRDAVLGLLLFAATFLAYRPAWNGQPVWDDDAHITKPELRSIEGLARIWTQPGVVPQYYPLAHSVFWLEYHLWGESTPGYHLLNIFLHVFSALLLVLILRGLALPGAWFVAALFALHPVQVESVAWIMELKNALSGVFFLGAGLAFFRFDQKRNRKSYFVALAFFILGLLAKSVIVTLPATLLVVFWWKRGKIEWKRDIAPLLPFFVIGIISGLFTAWVERRFIGAEGGEFNFTIIDRFLIANRAIWFYLLKLLWPARLIFIYPRWNLADSALWIYPFLTAFLFVMCVFWTVRRHARAPLALLLYFTITLFPALGFFNVYPFRYSFVADHFQYLACIGPFIAATAGVILGIWGRNAWLPESVQPWLCGILLFVLFLLDVGQSGLFADGETLYRDTIRKNPGCWMAYNNLGIQYMNQGRNDAAMAHLTRASKLNPKNAEPHNNLGSLLKKLGRNDEAMAHYLKAFELNPNYAEPHNNLGHLLTDIGQNDKAIAQFLRAVEINPYFGDAYYNLGVLLAGMGRTQEALPYFSKALKLNPNNGEAHNNLGVVLANMGQIDNAIIHFQKAVSCNPGNAKAQNNLGIFLEQFGRIDEAIGHYRKAIETNPSAIDALQNLIRSLLQKGQLSEAISALRNSLIAAKSRRDEASIKTIEQMIEELDALPHSPDEVFKIPAR